ncbi:MAG: OmpA family protein [Flavobacteriales bacterium]
MKTFALTCLFFLLAFGGWSANAPLPSGMKKLKSAEQRFSEFDYFDALDGFKAVHEDVPDNTFAVRRIADCYRLMGVPEEALVWYAKLQDMGGYDDEDDLHMAEVLRKLGRFEAALDKTRSFAKYMPDDSRGRRILAQPNYHVDLNENGQKVNVEASNTNVKRALLPPTEVNELLYIPIATEIDGPWYAHRRNLVSYDLFQTSVDEAYNLVSAELVDGEINTQHSDGPSCYDSKRETLLVTRFFSKRGKPVIDEQGEVYAMIFAYKLNGSKWEIGDEFPFNDHTSSTAYPALSNDGNTLYFASNRPGGFGGMDLWKSTWDTKQKQWTEPVNLGPDINTEGNEIYPQISKSGELSFASDGHPGLGGLDIFMADLRTTPFTVRNPGMPLNTPDDDFGLMYIGDEYGYFCSDRNAENGGDDLFWWEGMRETIEASVMLMDALGNPMYPAHVEIRNVRTDKSVNASGLRGSFAAVFNGRDSYEITWSHQGKEHALFCRPESDEFGLRYIYASRSGDDVMADAALTSYKESAFRKKKIHLGSSTAKNLTDSEAYPTKETAEPSYLIASWSEGITDAPHPAEGSKIIFKNLETGAVVSATVRGNRAALPADPRHMHAMTWTDAADRKNVRYLKPAEWAETGLAFTDGEPCLLQVSDYALYANINAVPTSDIVANALVASAVNGILLEDAPELLSRYVDAGRKVLLTEGLTQIHAEDVYFGFDRTDISSDEFRKLDELAELATKMPGAIIRIRAHTDSRGSGTYNAMLSRKRAESAKQSLLKLGVNEAQVTIEWAGEKELVNECADGVRCDPRKHRMNRRAEVYLVLPS